MISYTTSFFLNPYCAHLITSNGMSQSFFIVQNSKQCPYYNSFLSPFFRRLQVLFLLYVAISQFSFIHISWRFLLTLRNSLTFLLSRSYVLALHHSSIFSRFYNILYYLCLVFEVLLCYYDPQIHCTLPVPQMLFLSSHDNSFVSVFKLIYL